MVLQCWSTVGATVNKPRNPLLVNLAWSAALGLMLRPDVWTFDIDGFE